MSENSSFATSVVKFCISFICFVFVKPNVLLAQETRVEQSSFLVEVNEIEITGNTLFSDSKLIGSITPLEKNRVTLDRLIQARQEITDYYTEKGYIATGAFILPQKLNKGKVNILIVEGKLSEIVFEQNNIVNRSYIISRLPSSGTVLNLNELRRALSNLQKSSFIKSIKSTITFTETGRIKLLLDVRENPRLTKEFVFSNSFSPSIGKFGGQAKFRFNALGIGDLLEISTIKTQGLDQFSALYSFPINKHDAQISFGYFKAKSDLVLEELKELDINGQFHAYSINFNQPILFGNGRQLELGISFGSEKSESFILDDFSLSFLDELDNGTIKVSELSFTQQYSNKKIDKSFVLLSTFSVGIDLFDSTVTESGKDGLYWKWHFQSQGIFKLNSAFNLFSDIKLQVSPDNLFPSKQFSLGGISSVRGYSRNLLLGNNGISVTKELQTSLYKTSNLDLRLIGFIDVGKIWGEAAKINIDRDTLLSSGFGLQILKNELLNIRLDYAFPLFNTDNFTSESSTPNFTFTLQFVR